MQLLQNEFHKDESLDRLADAINVAQFVSFSPGVPMRQRYARVLGYPPNHLFSGLRDAIEKLMRRSQETSLNVRSFTLQDPRSNEFLYGLTSTDEIQAAVQRIAGAGLYVIVNETVDVKDGGVSGVVQGDAIEFAPDDTPRCVEKPGVASLPRAWGIGILEKVYGFPIGFGVGPEFRLEFSIHPKPRGWKHTHLLGWELERVGLSSIMPNVMWPNDFSRLIGDKVFGLLLGSEIGLPVPKSTVISRRIAPFSFGEKTGSAERWIRTSPKEQVPGKFTTHRGWIDPFALLEREDPQGNQIASVISQCGVHPHYSGALIVSADGKLIIEGKSGEGEMLMKGVALPEKLPDPIRRDVLQLYDSALAQLGPVRFEWVHDGQKPWVVQLHRGATISTSSEIVPGDASKWRKFEVARGLEALRQELDSLDSNEGIILQGQVGLTSHIADVVRKAGKPARLVPIKKLSMH